MILDLTKHIRESSIRLRRSSPGMNTERTDGTRTLGFLHNQKIDWYVESHACNVDI